MLIIRIVRTFDEIDNRSFPLPLYMRLISISVASENYVGFITEMGSSAMKNGMRLSGFEESHSNSQASEELFIEHVYINVFIVNKRRVLKRKLGQEY